MTYDVVIVGGGPAGLSAALALGRARKRVLVCDAGPRRNAAAEHIQNFVTRDGTPPQEFRNIARAQLAHYPNVEVRDVGVASISGERGAFRISTQNEIVDARRVLLATGMVDEMLPIEGYQDLWGRSIFQCPYCHGWEIKDTRWGYLPHPGYAAHLLPFAMQIRGWTRDVVVFTNGAFEIAPEVRGHLDAANVRVETAPIARLVTGHGRLEALALENGTVVPRDALFSHPPQRQIELVRQLGVELDEEGFVRVDPMKRETSIPGIYAAGDLTTRMQAAVIAAASGMQAAAAMNMELTMELISRGEV